MRNLEQILFQSNPLSRFFPLLLWVTGAVCFTSNILYFFSPIPLALIGIFFGRKQLIFYSALSIGFVMILFQSLEGLLLLSFALGLAWIWNEFSKLKIPIIHFLLISIGGSFTILAITLLILSDGNIPAYVHSLLLNEIKVFLDAPTNQYPQFFNQQGLREILSKQPEEYISLITGLLPGIIACTVAFLTWIVISIAKEGKAVMFLELPESLTLWSAPSNFVWIVVFSIPLTIWSDGILKVCGYTGLFIAGSCYFLHGLSVVRYWFLTKRVASWIRLISYFLIFLIAPFTSAIIGLGLFDPILHFRERMQDLNNEEEGELV